MHQGLLNGQLGPAFLDLQLLTCTNVQQTSTFPLLILLLFLLLLLLLSLLLQLLLLPCVPGPVERTARPGLPRPSAPHQHQHAAGLRLLPSTSSSSSSPSSSSSSSSSFSSCHYYYRCCSCCVSQGLLNGQLGPAFLDLQLLTCTNVQQASALSPPPPPPPPPLLLPPPPLPLTTVTTATVLAVCPRVC